jgi:GDP-4-dehydro-6-deoxy-D-mannose reductase
LSKIAPCFWENDQVRRAIVTGADGFLGRHLVDVLEQHGVVVTALTRRSRPDASHIAMGDADWRPARLAEIVEAAEPEAIFHLVGGAAGCKAELEQVNLGVTTSVMQALREVGARPLLVCCGSAAEYGAALVDGVPACETTPCSPVSAYGASKLAQTKAALEFSEATGTPVLVARIFNPIGPGMPSYLALGDFARQIVELPPGGILQTGNVYVYRDFIDVAHVVNLLLVLAQNPAARGVVNICSGEATQLSRLVDYLIDLSGKNVRVEPVPVRVRPNELAVVVGSTARLARLGARPPRTDYDDVMARVWHHATTCWATV